MLPLILMGAKLASDMAKDKGDRLAAATQTAYSPWTGMGVGKFESSFKPAETIAGTAAGIKAQEQADERFDMDKKMHEARLRQMSPWMGMAGANPDQEFGKQLGGSFSFGRYPSMGIGA